jgi:hypothetical protein
MRSTYEKTIERYRVRATVAEEFSALVAVALILGTFAFL